MVVGNETTSDSSSLGVSGRATRLDARSRRMSDFVSLRVGRDRVVEGELCSVSWEEMEETEMMDRGRATLRVARSAARRPGVEGSTGSDSVRGRPRRSAAEAECRRVRVRTMASSSWSLADATVKGAEAGPALQSRSRPQPSHELSSPTAGDLARGLGAGDSGLPTQEPHPSE